MAAKQKKRPGIGLLPKVLAGIVLLLLCFQLIRISAQITEAKTREDALTQQVSALQEKNDALQQDIDNAQDEDLIKDIARDELGLVEPGEKVFHDVSNGN